jgi:hypothetical protein
MGEQLSVAMSKPPLKPDMHAAIPGALRLNSDRSERQRGGDRRIGGRRDGDADHGSGLAASQISISSFSIAPSGPSILMIS